MDIIESVRFLLSILKYLGLWSYKIENGGYNSKIDNKWQRWLYKTYAICAHLFLTFGTTFMMYITIVLADDLEQVSDIVYITVTETTLLVKVINIHLNAVHLTYFLHLATTSELLQLRNYAERSHWQRQQKNFRCLSIVYMTNSLLVASGRIFSVLISGDKTRLPFAGWLPIDWKRGGMHYWCGFAYDALAMYFTCMSNITLDMLYCYLMLHVSLCLQLLDGRMRDLGQGGRQWRQEVRRILPRKVPRDLKVNWNEAVIQDVLQSKSLEDSSEMNLQESEDMQHLVQLHNCVKRLQERCELIVTYPILAQIVLSTLIICFSCYSLHNKSPTQQPAAFVTLLFFALAMTLQIFMPCYYGNKVIECSTALLDAIYHSNWTQCTARTRHSIYVYMEYLKRPIVLRARLFFHIGLPVFTQVMHNAYSLFALLVNTNV